jgi:hypothetical protein
MNRSIIRRLFGRGGLFVYLTSLMAVGSVLGVGQARAQAPDLNAKPTYGTATLKTGFRPDPFTIQLTAGGPIKKLGGPIKTELGGVKAYIAKAPDFRLHYTAGNFPLRIFVESKGDTTLLVNLPNGTWVANDDGGGGRNPLLSFAKPQSGRYDIWVGTFGEKNVPATLRISELTPDKVVEPTNKPVEPAKKPAAASRLIVCSPVDWVQVDLDAGLGWFGRDVPGLREAPETKDSLTAMLKKHGFETQYRGVKGTGGSVKLQLFARLTKESRTPNTAVSERADREVKAIADMVYGGAKAVGKKVYMVVPK